MPRLLFVVDDDSYFCSHRLHLGRAARRAGYEVLVATRVERHGKRIQDEGFRVIPIQLQRGLRSPRHDLMALVELLRLYRREKPDVVHHVALKMVLFGSIAARVTCVPVRINAVTGLGHLFHGNSWRDRLLRQVLMPLLRWALRAPRTTVIVQNEEDRDELVQSGVVPYAKTVLIKGAGVDMRQFHPRLEADGDPVVLLPARILRDKGVGEFIEAAARLGQDGVRARYVLCGDVDPYNPSSFTVSEILTWTRAGIVEWWGHRDDMTEVYAMSHVVVLPSHHEGLPKVLLEGAASGRPLIATRIRGCRDVVRHGENGLLVPVNDPASLAAAMRRLVEDPSLRARMGTRGRRLVAEEFACESIAAQTLPLYGPISEPSGQLAIAFTER